MTTKTATTTKIDNKKEYSPNEIAAILDVDPKTIRRVIRNVIPRESHPGRGGAWRIKGDLIDPIKTRLEAAGSGIVSHVNSDMIKAGE